MTTRDDSHKALLDRLAIARGSVDQLLAPSGIHAVSRSDGNGNTTAAGPAAASEAALDLDLLMSRVRTEVLSQRLKQSEPGPVQINALDRSTLQSAMGVPLGDAVLPTTVQGLLASPDLADEAFVRGAYLVILNREPDPAGFTNYFGALKSHRLTRQEVLEAFQDSAEGRQHRKHGGFHETSRSRRFLRFAVLRKIYAAIRGIWRFPRILRSSTELFVMTWQQNQKLGLTLHELERAIETKLRDMDARTSVVSGHLSQAIRQLDLDRASRSELAVIGSRVITLGEAVDRQLAAAATFMNRADFARLATETLNAIDSAREILGDLSSRMVEEATFNEFANSIGGELVALRQTLAEKVASAEFDPLTRNVSLIRDDLTSSLKIISSLSSNLNEKASRSDIDAVSHFVDALRTDLDAAMTQVSEISSALAERRSTFNIRFPHRVTQGSTGMDSGSAEGQNAFDTFYFAFEDKFRGARELIKERLSIYVPMIRSAEAGTAAAPLIDIGSGRGELLEILRDSGLVGRGVDINRAMVETSRSFGLDVVEGDAIGYLAGLPEGSAGAVSAIHVVEHLPFNILIALLDETYRVLKSGGVAIFETPNPENLLVGACSFYFDPTHIRPLPPESVRFTVEQRGFDRVQILRLHPERADVPPIAQDTEWNDRLVQTLFGPQDYAIIAYKP